MRHLKVLALGLVLVLGLFSVPVWAATTGTINVTVTPENISLSVSPDIYNYGALGLNTTTETATTFAVTNNGNVSETFLVKGYDTDNWTLAGTSAADQYVHDWKQAAGSYAALTTSNATAASGVAMGNAVNYKFRITTPQSTSSFAAQSPNVTFTATE